MPSMRAHKAAAVSFKRSEIGIHTPPVARTVNMTAREIQLLRIGSDLRSGCPIIWPAAGTLAGDSCPASLPLAHPHGRTQWRTRSGGSQQGEKHYDQEDHDQHGIGINHGAFPYELEPTSDYEREQRVSGQLAEGTEPICVL